MTQAELLAYIPDQIRSGGQGGLTLASEARDLLVQIVNSIYAQIAASDTSNQQNLEGYVPQNGAYTINDLKTFTELPQSTVTPASPGDLTTKAYVDALIAALSGSISVNFDSTSPIKRQVLGLENIVLGKSTIADTLQELLYPTKYATGFITGPAFHVYGDNTNAAINYTLVKTDQPITAASINSVNISVGSGDSQSGVLDVPQNPANNTLFTLTVVSGGKTYTSTFTSVIMFPFFVGQSTKDNVITPMLSADINVMAMVYGDGPVSINVAANKYLVIACPEGNNLPFTINGVTNNNFTINNYSLTNSFGNVSNYILYVSKMFATGTDIVYFLNPQNL